MWRLLFLGLFLGGWSTAPDAKPLLDSSEETYSSVCISSADTPGRLIEICHLALQDPGASPAQRMLMQEALGNAYIDIDSFELAETTFNKMLAIDAGSFRALRGLGWIAHYREDYSSAAKLFQKSIDIEPTSTALAGLADSRWELGDIPADDAIVLLEAALAISPGYDWARRSKGWILLDEGRKEEALALFQKIVDDYPEDQNAIAGLLRANRQFDRQETVLELANLGLSLNPDSFWFLEERSRALFMLDRYRQSIKDAERLIQMDKAAAEGYVMKARALAGQGYRDRALSFLAAAESEVGENNYLIYWRASTMLDDGQYNAARGQITRNTNHPDADEHDFALLCLTEYYREDYTAARKALDRALDLNPDESYSIYYDAMLMLEEKKGAEAAIERFDDAMSSGLPDRMIGEFAGDLIRAGYYAHAIAIRARYSD